MNRFALLCAVLCLPPAAYGDESSPVEGAAGFFALSVSDLDASVQWYTEMLDLTATRLPSSPKAQIALLQGDGLAVELVQVSAAFALQDRLPDVQKRYLVHGIFKAGFFVKDLDATVAELGRRGATFKVKTFTDEVLRARSILLLDNSGNTIQLFERLPEE